MQFITFTVRLILEIYRRNDSKISNKTETVGINDRIKLWVAPQYACKTVPEGELSILGIDIADSSRGR